MEIIYKVPKELEASLRNVKEADVAKLFTDILTVMYSTKKRSTINSNLEYLKKSGDRLEKSVDSNRQLLLTIVSNQSKILSYLESDPIIETPITPIAIDNDDEEFTFDDDDITF